MEHQVIIPSKEYESLLKIKDEFRHSFNKDNCVIMQDIRHGVFGIPIYDYHVITNDDMILKLNENIQLLTKELYAIRSSHFTLLNKKEKKPWYCLF